MVKLWKIYTRGGDKGETSLAGGERTKKSHPRIEAMGRVDEANATIGIARTATDLNVTEALARIQNDLFDLGADLARPAVEDTSKDGRITQAQIDRLESEIDAINEKLEPLESFILPGGSLASAYLHLARVQVRSAERAVWSLAAAEKVTESTLAYLNRLSDLLFVLCRHCNRNGKDDVLWQPGLYSTAKAPSE